jgi:hypothetical protein
MILTAMGIAASVIARSDEDGSAPPEAAAVMMMPPPYEGDGALRLLLKRGSSLTKGPSRCCLRGKGQAQRCNRADKGVSYIHVESFHIKLHGLYPGQETTAVCRQGNYRSPVCGRTR